ncbi:Uncharacterised protein g8131 [Pycnogonum litorale]
MKTSVLNLYSTLLMINVCIKSCNGDGPLTAEEIEKSRSRTLKDVATKGTTVVSTGTLLAVLVTSSPEHFIRRQTIRSAWNHPRIQRESDSTIIFLIGQSDDVRLNFKVEEESERRGDVHVGRYKDRYENLTTKVVDGMKWIARFSPRFILKTDDDCFVNVPLVEEFLRNHNRQLSGLYVGNVRYDSPVVRNRSSRWYVSPSRYSKETYPPYPVGLGYVMSADVLRSVISKVDLQQVFPNEDAYVGVAADSCGVEPIHSSRFHLHSHGLRTCNLNYLMVVHRVNVQRQRRLMKKAFMARLWCKGPNHNITTWN